MICYKRDGSLLYVVETVKGVTTYLHHDATGVLRLSRGSVGELRQLIKATDGETTDHIACTLLRGYALLAGATPEAMSEIAKVVFVSEAQAAQITEALAARSKAAETATKPKRTKKVKEVAA